MKPRQTIGVITFGAAALAGTCIGLVMKEFPVLQMTYRKLDLVGLQ